MRDRGAREESQSNFQRFPYCDGEIKKINNNINNNGENANAGGPVFGTGASRPLLPL